MVISEDGYIRQKKLFELQLESSAVLQADAVEKAGKLISDLPKLWEAANIEEQRNLLLTMLESVYVDTRNNMVIAVKPKPPFRPVFQVAALREGSVIEIRNGSEDHSPNPSLFLVEAGKSRTSRPKEATQNILQA